MGFSPAGRSGGSTYGGAKLGNDNGRTRGHGGESKRSKSSQSQNELANDFMGKTGFSDTKGNRVAGGLSDHFSYNEDGKGEGWGVSRKSTPNTQEQPVSAISAATRTVMEAMRTIAKPAPKNTHLAGDPATNALSQSLKEINELDGVRDDLAKEYIDSKIFGEVSGRDFAKHYDNAMANSHQKIMNTTAGNMIGGVVGGMMPGTGHIVGDIVANKVLSHAGDIANRINQEKPPTEAEKKIQDYADRQINETYKSAEFDDFGDYAFSAVRLGLAGVTGLASESLMSPASAAYDREQGLNKVAQQHGKFGNIAERHQQYQQNRIASAKERNQIKALGGANTSGILATMQSRLNTMPNTLSAKYSQQTHGIPSFSGLWDNIEIVK